MVLRERAKTTFHNMCRLYLQTIRMIRYTSHYKPTIGATTDTTIVAAAVECRMRGDMLNMYGLQAWCSLDLTQEFMATFERCKPAGFISLVKKHQLAQSLNTCNIQVFYSVHKNHKAPERTPDEVHPTSLAVFECGMYLICV
jgi:hypothetical protein